MSIPGLLTERKIYTVSQLTEQVKETIEGQFPDIWVEGEISNVRTPASGHLYLTLKDDASQLRAVCFRSQNRQLKFRPEDGLAVLARGRLTVYQPRGDYQLIVDYMEPQGIGSLQLAFEQLKAKLQEEGLFDPARKQQLPLLPRKIGVVTSATGAAIRDILRILRRRNRNLHVLIFPVRVQGDGSALEIAAGVRYLAGLPDIDVIIAGRGGGSIEDLWAFNEEVVARAIYESPVPVISAVGHETDFTISDFVADLRAPTPSAAAERVSAVRSELQERVATALNRQRKAINFLLTSRRQQLDVLARSRAFNLMEGRIRLAQQRIDEMRFRSGAAVKSGFGKCRERYTAADRRLVKINPLEVLRGKRAKLTLELTRLRHTIRQNLDSCSNRMSAGVSKLQVLSPLAILARGYAICHDRAGMVVTDAGQLKRQDSVRIRLSRGLLDCEVKEVQTNESNTSAS